MKMKSLSLGGLALLTCFSTLSYADTTFNPKGVNGSVGVGFVRWNLDQVYTNFDLDQGVYAFVQGEKGVGFLNLYLTIGFSFLTAEGMTNYDYTTVGGSNYTGTNVNFQANLFQPTLGLKWKILNNSFFRPYAEGGGIFGFFQINYSDTATKVTGPGSDAKTSDTIFDLGYYGEGGIEIDFSPVWGVKLAYRYTFNKTRPFKTLANTKLKYNSEVFILGLLAHF